MELIYLNKSYCHNRVTVTIVPKTDNAMSSTYQVITEDIDISKNLLVYNSIHKSFNTFIFEKSCSKI